jgi:hypothetical protein
MGTGPTVKVFKPAFELDELNVSVIVEYIDPHPEMEYMAMRTSKKRYIIFITSI